MVGGELSYSLVRSASYLDQLPCAAGYPVELVREGRAALEGAAGGAEAEPEPEPEPEAEAEAEAEALSPDEEVVGALAEVAVAGMVAATTMGEEAAMVAWAAVRLSPRPLGPPSVPTTNAASTKELHAPPCPVSRVSPTVCVDVRRCLPASGLPRGGPALPGGLSSGEGGQEAG